jgi:hypothetical protein
MIVVVVVHISAQPPTARTSSRRTTRRWSRAAPAATVNQPTAVPARNDDAVADAALALNLTQSPNRSGVHVTNAVSAMMQATSATQISP